MNKKKKVSLFGEDDAEEQQNGAGWEINKVHIYCCVLNT